MYDTVKNTILSNNLITKGDKVLAAVSGGADSMAMLYTLLDLSKEIQFFLFAGHINHNLRGDEANKDEELVKNTCRSLNIDCFCESFDVLSYAKMWRVSAEVAGRNLRYTYLKKKSKDLSANKIALAHHKNDNTETILHNILRGTGIKGLTGIKYIKDGLIIRPLLDVSKDDILEYCSIRNIDFRNDLSNSDNIYTRNRIRNELLPYIKDQFNPRIEDSLLRLSKLASDDDNFLDEYCKTIYKEKFMHTGDEVTFLLKDFLSLHRAVKQRVLRIAVYEISGSLTRLEYEHIDNTILYLESKINCSVNLPFDISVYKDENIAVLRKQSKNIDSVEYMYELPVPGEILIQEAGIVLTVEIFNGKICGYGKNPIFLSNISAGTKLIVRNRRNGDRFYPLGMRKEKKLKDFFIDRKIPKVLRDKIPLLICDEIIVSIIGQEICEANKVVDGSKEIVKITFDEIKEN